MHNVGPIAFTGLQFGVCQTTSEGGRQTVARPANPAGESSPAVGFCSLGVFAVPHVLNGITVTDGDG